MESTIRLLDLNDDILCDILRRVAATEDGKDCGADGFLPLLKVGAGRENLDSFALLQTAGTCKRFRQVVCTTLPTRLVVRLKFRTEAEISLKQSVGRILPPKSASQPWRWWKGRSSEPEFAAGSNKSQAKRAPFTSADEVDVGSVIKPAMQWWLRPEHCLAQRGIRATPAGLTMETCRSFLAMQFLRNLDVVTCRLEPPVGCLGVMAKITQLTALAFTLHPGVTGPGLLQLTALTGLQSLAIICDTAPRVQVQTMAMMLKSFPHLGSLTVDSSRSIAEGALLVLHHLGSLTSLDLMRCNPDCALFYPTVNGHGNGLSSVPSQPSSSSEALQSVVPGSGTSSSDETASRSPASSAAQQPIVVRAGSSRYGTAATFPVAYPGMLHPPENPLHEIVAQRAVVPEHLKCTSLRQLRLSHLVQSSSDSIMKFLARFPHLACVELMFCERVTSAALEPLATLSSLQRLSLIACPRVDKNVMPRAATVPALLEIDLTSCVHATDALLHHLSGGTVSEGGGLRSLILDSCSKITVEGIAGLTRFQNLRVLSMAFMSFRSDADLLSICQAHPKLEALSLEGCVQLSDACLTVIAQTLPAVQQLDLTSIKIRDSALVALAPLQNLSAIRMRPQIERDTIQLMTHRSVAPVWPVLATVPKQQKWNAGFRNSKVGGFASVCWKLPGDPVEGTLPAMDTIDTKANAPQSTEQ